MRRRLAEALGRTLGVEIGADALIKSRDGVLAEAIAGSLASRSRDETVLALLAAGVPAAPALRAAEALESEWLWENGVFEVWNHPRLGDILGVRAYADFSRTPSGFRHPTPDLGEHSTALLAELGVSPERIADLLATGAVFEPAHIAPHLAKSARTGNDNAALSVS
jgi:crotonobetainyl-CoA:carnitine CoA-transferase CaiB-like acyl-CoA transferase